MEDATTLERIRGIVIPPAWTDVRISDDPDSHLQAVGRDQRGRLQYRYHPDWTAFRDRVKFDHLPAFANALPSVRKRIDADLALPGVPRDKVLATVAELLQTTLIRVGNDEYARENGAYGLTTFRNRHAKVSGSEIAFVFTGKSGITHEVRARDRRVAKVLRECQEIPGQRLFQYLDDDGAPTPVHSHDVNDYLRETADADITAKDFRTWVATVAHGQRPRSARSARARNARSAPSSRRSIEEVAADLGNTPTVCRASYVHPRVLEAFPTGALQRCVVDHSAAQGSADARRAAHPRAPGPAARSARERAEKEALAPRELTFPDVAVQERTVDTSERRWEPMNDPVAILKRDHREVAQMLKTLDASKPGARRRQTVDKLTQALELHMEIEERDIYPVVQRVVGKEEAEEAGIEHRLAREGLSEVRRLVDEPGFGAAVAMLTAGIRHHVKEEETEVFPELKKKIDREELSELGDRVAAAKKPKRRTAAAA